MSITGNIQTMELAELLQWLSQGSKTGTLVIDNGEVTKRIFFRNGRIISSASTDPHEHLGHFLVSHGFITENELAKAMANQETSKMLLGKILTTAGAISEQDLHRLLRLKAEESIYDLFAWKEGEFRFMEEELPNSTMVPMDLDVTSIVLEGVHRIDEWLRIREAIPNAQAIPVSITDLLADPNLSPAHRHVLEQVNDDRTVEEIQIQTHSSEFLVSKVLYEQARLKRLKIVRPRWANPGESPASLVAGAAAGNSSVGADELVVQAKKLISRKEFEKGLRHLRAARSLEPDSKSVLQAMEKGEEIVAAQMELAGISLDSVPSLTRTMQELTKLRLSPQEGFILTRVNASYDIRSIVKISPMPQIDALLVFYRLLEAGHIELT
jgi:hypothetical protein